MDAERWQRIQQIFEGALERPEEQRPLYLAEACGDDDALRQEVDSLLVADAEAGASIEAAVQGGRELLATEPTRIEPEGLDDLDDLDEITSEISLDPALLDGAFLDPDASASVPLPASGPHFGKYRVDARIGQGGFGVVYRGHDPTLNRRVAIKTCTGRDPALRRRFYREAQIAAGLQHRNIVTVHELGVEEGVPYLVQELLGGEDLQRILERGIDLDLFGRIDILLQVAKGLEHAHRAGVLHRDVKPSNVRVLEDGGVKLLDFGIAKLLNADSQLTGTGVTLGTVGYLAPEQLRSEPIDERADIFAFGVVAYEVLAGERPFKGADFSQVSYQLLFVDPKPVAELWPECPAVIDNLVGRCLEKDTAKRYRNFQEVIRDLEPLHQLLGSGDLPAHDPTFILAPKEQTPSGETDFSEAPTVLTPQEGLADAPTGPQPTTDSFPGVEASTAGASRGRWTLFAAGLAGVILLVALGRDSGDTPSLPEDPPVEEALTGTDEIPPVGSPSMATDGADIEPSAPRIGPVDDSAAEDVPGGLPADEPSLETPSDDGGPPAQRSPGLSALGRQSAPERQSSSGRQSSQEQSSPGPQTAEPPPAVDPVPSQAIPSTVTVPPSAPSMALVDMDGAGQGEPPNAGVGQGEADSGTAGDTADGSPTENAVALGDESVDATTNTDRPSASSGSTDASGSASQAPAEDTSEGMRAGDLITAEGPGVVPPQRISGPQPTLPPRINRRALRRSGGKRIVVRVFVDETGAVLQAVVAQDEEGYGEAARQAALATRFEPATRDGVAGRMWTNLPFEFKAE